MSAFTATFERLELKFLIDERDAEGLRPQIEPYCEPDSHCREAAPDRPGRVGYGITSLYLDTPALAFHQAKERGDANRVKLRVRHYAGASRGTLEVKRRRSAIIYKTRAIIPRDRVQEAVEGLVALDGSQETRFLDDFRREVAHSGAQPTLLVRYEREAYESRVDHYARVTFDRRIQARRTADWDLDPGPEGWADFDDHWGSDHLSQPVVMEIKCETAIPNWVSELIHSNELALSSFSKYSIGVVLTGAHLGLDCGRSRALRAMG